jgi:signal transduction histidine kinase
LIERTIKDGKRAADVVSRIRDFFRKGADAEGKNLEINETILGVIELTRAAMSEKRVMVTMQLAKELPRILGDRVQLQQVILNLMMNAIEAMSNTSQIESGGVLVAVSDSGLGLPPANSGRIFEAFYTSKPSGLGMGLSICRSIVEAHGGRLWAAPNKPRGAILCMTPPIGEKSLENLEPTEASFRLKGELS